jgi:chemotaxis protein MotA
MLVCVAGGYAMAGGKFGILFQPSEFIVIGGAALGGLVISAPGKVLSRVVHAIKFAFSGNAPSAQDYKELLLLLYSLFQLMRREGILGLESHLWEPEKSSLFQKYPSVLKRHHAITFLVEGLKQLLDGCPAEDLAQLLEAELDTHTEEEHEPIGLIRTVGDALPGLGIVAAVLGIIITMGHLDGGPEVIGHHVGAALVGTFLGVLLCYGVIQPLAAAIEIKGKAETRYLVCIKAGLLAAARGANPAIAIEFARRSLFADERPAAADLDAEMKGKKE